MGISKALEPEAEAEDRGRKRVKPAGGSDRLKRHRMEVAGRVRIPDTWGQEKHLKDWNNCADLDMALFPGGLLSAKEALVHECRRAAAARVQVANPC